MSTTDHGIKNAPAMVNLASYPIDDTQSVEGSIFVKKCREQYLEKLRLNLFPNQRNNPFNPNNHFINRF
jgi:hypothetical protein